MQKSAIASVCLLLAIRTVTGHTIDQLSQSEDQVRIQKTVEPKLSMAESLFAGITKSLISRTGSSSQNNYCLDPDVLSSKRSTRGYCKMSSMTTLSSPCKFFKMANGFCDLPDILTLSLNLSNVVLMLVLKGLIWGVSYMQTNGHKSGRKDDIQDAAITETDLLLFLGYLVADESGHYDCLNRVACEQPARADAYLRSAEMVWKIAKMLDGVVSLDEKYEKMLIRLQEAIEDGSANGDCEAKYKCSEPITSNDHFNLV